MSLTGINAIDQYETEEEIPESFHGAALIQCVETNELWLSNGVTTERVGSHLSGSTTISVTDNTNAALRITQTGTGNALLVEDSTNPDSTPFVIDGTGNIIKGALSAIVSTAGVTPVFQLHSDGSSSLNSSLYANWDLSTGQAAIFNMAKSVGDAVGTQAIVASNQLLGTLQWLGSDGTAFVPAASISAQVDGTPGTNGMPGRLVFSTTADGASSPTERMRINNAGRVGIGGTNSLTGVNLGRALNDGTSSYGFAINASAGTSNTAGVIGYSSYIGAITGTSFSQLLHFRSDQASISDATIQSQYGFYASSGVTGATNNYGFYGAIPAGSGRYNLYMGGTASNYLAGPLITAGLKATSAAAPTLASATTIAPTTQIAFVSGVTPIVTITAPSPISLGGGQITLIPTGIFTTTTAGNIALASTAVVGKALIMTYDATTTKWYPSY